MASGVLIAILWQEDLLRMSFWRLLQRPGTKPRI